MMARLIVLLAVSITLLSVSVYWKNTPEIQTKESVAGAIERNLGNEIEKWKIELQTLADSPDAVDVWSSVDNSFFLRDSSGIARWSTNKYFPDPTGFDNDSIEYHHSGNNHYLVIQQVLLDNRIITGFLILQESYSIENQYLNTSLNSNIFSDYNVSFQSSGEPVSISHHKRKLFSVSVNSLTRDDSIDILAWTTFSIGLALLIWFLWNVIAFLLTNKRKITSVVVCFISLLGIRFLMVYGNFPSLSNKNPIFDPVEFASSVFNNSIGNLLLNTIALLWIAIFTFYVFRDGNFYLTRTRNRTLKIIVATILLVLFFAAQLLPFLYLETIYHNSVVTPDISQQLSFGVVRVCAFGCILLSSVAGIVFSITFFRLAAHMMGKNFKLYAVVYILAAIVSLTYHFATDRNYEVPFVLISVNLLVLIYTSINRRLRLIAAGITSLILFELVIYGVQSSLAIRRLTQERQHDSMLKFGNTFLVERDVLGEYMLNQAISKIERDAFIQQQMVNPFNRLSTIEQKIRRSHLNSYFDRYDTKIYLYDNSGLSVGSPKETLTNLVQGFVPLAENTSYKGIYVIKNPANRLIKRYLAIIPVRYHVSGYIVIDMTLRQVLPSAVFPKLLLDSRFSNYANSSEYSYAIFKGDSVLSSAGDFNYQGSAISHHFRNDNLFKKGITMAGYDHVGIIRSDNQVTVISIKHDAPLNVVANFSFFLLLGISMVIVALLIVYFSSGRHLRISYSNKIRLYVYLAMILPLMALAITILRVNTFTETKRSEEISVRQARNIANSLASLVNGNSVNIEEALARQSQSAGVDVTIFTKEGSLIASSQPDVYGNQILSRFIDPQALHWIYSGTYSFTIDDAIGKLKFRNTYSAILSSDTKNVLGIVSIPFFTSQESFEKDQISLVVNILAVFVLLLLVFYLMSYIALNWLIRPLKVVSVSLRQTTLSGTNKKLIWNSSDEIGTIVKEYNTMLDNLAKSKDELERRQREATWREMARQVAHEIKNPLTPIKLTLQQLQRLLRSGQVKEENAHKNIETVLRQVDILNDIASSFSAFAQMPEPKPERLDIVALVRETLTLFKEGQLNAIEFYFPQEPVWVKADRKLYSRIFSNIILNAIQSEKENEPIQLKISLTLNTPNITLLFADNGKGMPDEILDKIFIPYFSTKESGSGLGLAIAKQGIEQSGGRIWCESTFGKGTTFFILLPTDN